MTASPVLHPEVASMLDVLNEGFPDVAALSAPVIRKALRDRRAPLQQQPDMQRVQNVDIEGPGGKITLRVYRPYVDDADGPSALPVIVFAHGGGFVFCDLDSHDEFCRAMAQGVGAVVVSVDYRLAPEHPAPAAHEDVYAALEWAAKNVADYGGDAARIALAGDSAGGNLAATVAIAARDRGGPRVVAQVLIYPVIDDDFDTESYRRFGVGYYNTTTAMQWYWKQYAPHGTDDVRIVPTRAESLAGLPTAVVITAELDPPCSSGDDYAQKLADANVTVDHYRFEGLFHGFLTVPALSFTGPGRQRVWSMVRTALSGE